MSSTRVFSEATTKELRSKTSISTDGDAGVSRTDDNKVVLDSNDPQCVDPNFQLILENSSYRNIHYYAAGTVVHNYFGRKNVSNPSTSDVLENSLPYVEISDPKTNK
jgi:hypothetical protein